ncbi:MAG: hypothetical protein C1943_08060, partial [Halochromatium sp.]|nr:hypothetical protein [Halochromatium sp.]
MLTEIHHSTNRQLLFSFPEGSGDLADQRYALGLTICDNPVCDCSSLYFTLSPWRSAPDDDPDADSDADPDADPDADLDSDSDSDSVEHSEQPVKFAIDINSRELDIQNSPQAEARSIGTTFVETLSEEDWSLLTQAFYQYKRKATDETPDDDIKAEFPADEIERDSTMISFRSILPYAESKILDQDDQRFLVDDLYCVKAKCNCTDIVVRLLDTAMNVDTDERI